MSIDTAPLRRIIGANLRSIREEKGLSLRDLAKVINRSTTTLFCYETGQRSFSVDFLYLFATHMNIPVQRLLVGAVDNLEDETIDSDSLHRKASSESTFVDSLIKENLSLKKKLGKLEGLVSVLLDGFNDYKWNIDSEVV